ncbi:MAG: polyphosphate kinase 1 [Thomasclavelia sp.]|jgi:polyphosphate kinase|nr:polyphosphate kinase 1 [Thomasclavelia sp.]
MKGYLENRELSWLKFNDRVLMQADDKNVPLGEQLSFISIFQSNIDEFTRVRLGSLYDQELFYPGLEDDKTGMTAQEQIKSCARKIRYLYKKKDKILGRILSDLNNYDFEILNFKDIKSKEDKKYLEDYFYNELLPLISPQVISKRQPFPFLNDRELYIGVQLESKKGKRKTGVVSLTGTADNRLVRIPGTNTYTLSENIVMHFVSKLFPKYVVKRKSFMRVTRSADIDEDDINVEEGTDYLNIMETLIKQRRRLAPLRLELSGSLDDIELDSLKLLLKIDDNQIFNSKNTLDLSVVSDIRDILKTSNPELFYSKLEPRNSSMIENTTPMIKQIEKKDLMLAYPFESISPFLRLLNEASNNPEVVSIKMTLYRVAHTSKVVKALINAAENGKEVVVLVELRARFDEENNIGWAKRLEQAGAHVIYGLDHYKVHSKLLLITTKNQRGINYVWQVGTGNYNETTARLYTDLIVMSSFQPIGEEINDIFNHLLRGETVESVEHLMVAPNAMENKIIDHIDAQIELSKNGKNAYIGMKCNSVTSKVIMNKLVEASRAGVKIEMIVRGICCLVPGIKGSTENIKVISIVGRYLEHSRIYIFGKDNPEVYISSADLMTRNLEKRVEVAAPIYDEGIRDTLVSMFKTMFKDNVKASKLTSEGVYRKVSNKHKEINSQEYFFKKLK